VLVVVRHGRTAWNVEGRFQGWADVPLDDEGQRQSARLAAELAAALDRPVTVVSSDLRRAAATADAIGSAVGAVPVTDPDLREVDLGDWAGLTEGEVAARHPEEHRLWSAGRHVRRGGGETLAEAGARVARSIRAAGARAPGSLVIVGHGRSLQSGLAELARCHLVELPGGAVHLGNAEYLALADWRHDQAERALPHR
jgi:broad specificity phosphatase PhoE